ncbi:MAG TPA: DUF2147 domain-containing protein [Spirochaetes bacterium]|nr:DUF2147 domain-containing protein [Spirochaetota bacterium]
MKFTKGLFFITIIAVAFALCPAFAADSPVGMWKTIDDKTGEAKSFLQVWEKDGVYFGKVAKLIQKPGEDPNPKCTKCKGKLKDQPILGMTIMWGLKQNGDEYSGGNIMDPDNGQTYKCKIKVLNGGKKLEVRGFIGFSVIGRSQYWLKAD